MMASFSGEVLSEHDVAVHAAMRSRMHVIGMALFCSFFGALPFYPPVAAFLGASPVVTLSWGLVYAALFTASYFSFHHDGGRSLRYRWIHRIETSFAGLASAVVIGTASRSDTLLWVLLFSMAYQSGTVGTNRRFTAGVIVLTGLSAALSRLVRGDVAAALIGLALTTSATSIYLMLSAAAKHLAFVIADRESLQQRVADLEIQSERVRIARDLHDGLGTELSALVWSARMLEERVIDPAASRDVAVFSDRIRYGMQELRSIVWGLRGSERTVADLVQHLESRCREIAGDTLVSYVARVDDDTRIIAADTGVDFIRIVQEAVRNAARHASARKISVELEMSASLGATITDDGRGFAPQLLQASEGGLANMRTRAERGGGSVSIASRPGDTRVVVRLP